MKTFFKIRYELDRNAVHNSISYRLTQPGSDYICVADGTILSLVNLQPEYREVINGGLFSVCDSSFVPLYIRWIYGERYEQYCGSDIFQDIVESGKYRMIFLGTQQPILESLRNNLVRMNPEVETMLFEELPFRDVKDFDYPGIARLIEEDGADIVWVALGAPKQEYFMHYLRPHLHHGVMIAVGAAFKFFSDVDSDRAPRWMVRHHMEFIHRLYKEPKKQFRRCVNIVRTLPGILCREWKVKHNSKAQEYHKPKVNI